jgi:hypothetical protein
MTATMNHAHRVLRTRRILLIVGVVAAAVAVTFLSSREAEPTPTAGPLVPTGEHNDMGMPVVGLPGYSDGTATAGGIEVTGATWHLGTVPLNVAVRPYWTLTNTSDAPVTLGQPVPEVREGCCPGPLALDRPALAPGESATLTFELGMHTGMGGWHDLAVHVPLDSGDHLTLTVAGDFS